ncbi:hypothetical protein [Actinoplanes rectilineatus]|uniref:hypothetical protein n=1 Tax=Actinoplanes rectilineatus TaxID=113571 RepID=UPI0005F28AE6|nr:hypothetical protein [Actinoplanes rectilineatus]
MTYRTGGNQGITVVREGAGPADEDGRRPDDESVAFVVNGDRDLLARRIAELLTVVERVCDCGHPDLELRAHLHPCPVASLRDAHRDPAQEQGREQDEVVIGGWLHVEKTGPARWTLDVGGVRIWVDVDTEGRPALVDVHGPGTWGPPVGGCEYGLDWDERVSS